MPFTVLNATDVSNTNPGASGADRPNVVGKVNLSHPTVTKFFNTSAFEAQTSGTLGDERKEQYYGPHVRHTDFALLKNFKVLEDVKGQFRTECFNITNTSNFSAPNGTLGSGSFGKLTNITRGYTPREIQFALKVDF